MPGTDAKGRDVFDDVLGWIGRFVHRAIAKIRREIHDRTHPPEWEYVPEGWARAQSAEPPRGWDAESVVEAYRTRLPEIKRLTNGPAPLAFPTSSGVTAGDPNLYEQNSILIFGYTLARAAAAANRDAPMSVLDWGGGFGYHAFLARALLPDDVGLDYHVKDVSAVCAAARPLVPEVTFAERDDDVFNHAYDIVMASNALQYEEDWARLVVRLASVASRYLLITAVPTVMVVPPFVVLQRTQRYRFDTEYLSWVFRRDDLLSLVTENGLELVREFVQSGHPDVHGAPEPPHTRAFLFAVPRT